jgi:hypothetical protein
VSALDNPTARSFSTLLGVVPRRLMGPTYPQSATLCGHDVPLYRLARHLRPAPTGQGGAMASVLHEVVVDCCDVEAQATWWSRVLDWPAVYDDGGFWWISSNGTENAALALSFSPVAEGKTVKNRIHLDLNPSGCEQAEEVERLLSLGARHKDIGQGPDGSWVVLEDPEGNEFCLLRTRKD